MAHEKAAADMSETDAAPGLSPGQHPGQSPSPGRDATDSPERVEVIAIFGPTASGKTAVAEAVADALGTEVVSADAMQVYRGLPILTNQPERPTRLVAIRPLGDEMSRRRVRVARARGDRRRLVDERGDRGRRRRHRSLPPCSPRRPRCAAAALLPSSGPASRRRSTATAPVHTSALPHSTPPPPRTSTRTTDSVSCAPSSSRKPERR